MSNYLNTLNDQQLKAVKQIDGPVLILAGAGSGKTKSLTCRIAYMMESGISPSEILAITFTNKAAQEMRERIHALVGPSADKIWMYTFHSFGARFLRREISNYPPYNDKFTIYDSDDSKTLIKNILKELNLDDKQFQPNIIQAHISSAKGQLLEPKAFRAQVGSNFFAQKVADVYESYDKHLKQNNALDFDDLLFMTTKLLSIESIRRRWQDRFHYILIDEYQDTNHAQYLMAKLIAGKNQNICAVGDADQSIYSWRGADLRNIIDFQQDYPSAKVIKLEQNYRSTQTILDAANAVIQNNSGRPSKRLWTENNQGKPLILYTASDEHSEADFIVNTMRKEHNEEHQLYGNMAVLYRMNAQSRVIEEALVKSGIGYTMVGGTRFYDRAEIRDMLAYLKLVSNLKDNVSLMRIINVPKRGIGAATVQKLSDYANERNTSMFEAMMDLDGLDVSSSTKTKLQNFIAMMFEFLNASTETNVFGLLQKIMTDTKYLEQLQESKDPQVQSREENLGELLSVAKDFNNDNPEGGVSDFLEKVALVNDVDTYENENDRVTLMTIHSAKGLEFPNVFIVGMEDGVFPGYASIWSGDPSDIEEERRLCYVGITRAMKELTLTCAKQRMIRGETQYNRVSRFVREVPRELVDLGHTIQEKKPRVDDIVSPKSAYAQMKMNFQAKSTLQKKDFTVKKADSLDYGEGDTVRHVKFGVGIVKNIADGGRDYEVTVDFDKVGVKKMFAGFAKLKKI